MGLGYFGMAWDLGDAYFEAAAGVFFNTTALARFSKLSKRI